MSYTMIAALCVLLAVVIGFAILYQQRNNPRTGIRIAVLVAVAGVILLFALPLILSFG